MATLKRIISDLVRAAETHQGEPQRATLKGGLRVDVRIIRAGATQIQISRNGLAPSLSEFETVLKNFPYPIKAKPQSMKSAGRYFVTAAWATPARLPISTTEDPDGHPDHA